jgi:hypothetical protein
VPWPDYGCRLASLRDIACMKLSAIIERMPRMLWKVEWNEVKDVIRAWTRQAG